MNQAATASKGKDYGLALVFRVWELSRPQSIGDVGARRGLLQPNDAVLVEHIKDEIRGSLFMARGIRRLGWPSGQIDQNFPRKRARKV